MRDLAIIGGGAAGITAGIYAARKFIDTLLITSDFTGQVGISAWVENYPGFKKITGLDLIKNFKEHLDMFEIDKEAFKTVEKIKKIKGGFEIITDEAAYQAKSVIIASGSLPRKLNVKNEDKFLGKGISYCVTCDETAFKGKTVAVIGGGNAGLEGAIELSGFCSKVYVLEILNKLGADEILVEEAKKINKIKIITSAEIKAFAGNTDLEKIIYMDKKSNRQKELPIDGCFIEIGAMPNSSFVKGFLNLNKKEEIIVDPYTLETSIKGIFAAGDVNDLPGKQIVIACGQGAAALLSAYNYLYKN